MDNTRIEITVTTSVNKPVAQVWAAWNDPAAIMQWCSASDDWHAPAASNDLRTGGRFSTTMAARDGSFSFDFEGVYTVVDTHRLIAYTMGDGRRASIRFEEQDGVTLITETFDAEQMNPVEMQQAGWQAILDRFKQYVEAQA